MSTVSPDVLVLGEPLVEVSASEPFRDGATVRLAFSGDALNAAAAAAAAGAHTALLARVPDDELGDALVARVTELGIDTGAVIRVPGQHGVYFTHSDPSGRRQFAYARSGSAGSTLCPDDVA
ncbi:MAG: PfkB family carbohydrate kinase, partial [Saccharomonospora viridis]